MDAVRRLRMLEWTFESRKSHRDGFNAVDVDVVFARPGSTQVWRVRAFWRGGNRWCFAPPAAGTSTYRLEDVWQLHYSDAAAEQNFAAARIAELDERTAHWIHRRSSCRLSYAAPLRE